MDSNSPPQMVAPLPGDASQDGPGAAEARSLLGEYLAFEERTRWKASRAIARQKLEAMLVVPEEVQMAVARAAFSALVSGELAGADDAERLSSQVVGSLRAYEYRAWAHYAVWEFFMYRTLPYSAGELESMLEVAVRCFEAPGELLQPLGSVAAGVRQGPTLHAVQRFAAAHGLTPGLKVQLQRLRRGILAYREFSPYKVFGPYDIARIDELLGPGQTLPYETGEPWTELVLADLAAMDEAGRSTWQALLRYAATAEASKPSAKWLKQAGVLVSAAGEEEVGRLAGRWFREMSRQRAEPLPHWNTDLVKGLVWCCSMLEDEALCRALADLAETCFKRFPEAGLWSERVGNAGIHTLGAMPGTGPAAQLSRLRQRVKFRSAQVKIMKALAEAAQKAGLTSDELEELLVPTYGLAEPGLLRETIGRFTAEVRFTVRQTEWGWRTFDGKLQKSIPAEVKAQHPEELKALKQEVAEIEKMLPAQRDRIEALLRTRRSWRLPVWRERYLDHPLVADLARRLIWQIEDGERTVLGIWREGRLVDGEDQAVEGLSPEAMVSLWHPIGAAPEVVQRWRRWMEDRGVTQPFKQAHREVYLLTEAEVNTSTYSNRFAAHLLRQHQLKALCDQKGWQYRLELVYDGGDSAVARLELPQGSLHAEFWVDPARGDDDSWTDAGAFLYMSTDQVRFCDSDGQPRPLVEVPALIFSEVMRDVDLFVGVASVGNDPAWKDSGERAGWRDYWQRYAFGDLSASAATRQEVLQRLVPRLKIASRCALDGKFLVVRGDLRTYKIHLGSGNILMEPNDQYLCIVPDRSAAAKGDPAQIFLPFEGDRTLSLILSKAFLLAEDTKIKDSTITSQIRGR